MNKMILVCASFVAACTLQHDATPDAFQWEVPGSDAWQSPLPPSPPLRGCADIMGNLPNSRTVTLTPDDPVPSSLLNELEDQVIGARRKQFKRRFSPVFLFQSGGANGFFPAVNPSGATRPQIFQNAASTTSQIETGQWDEGDRITGASMEAFGNGNAFQFDFLLYTGPSIAESALGSQSFPALSAAWQTLTLSSFTARVLLATDIMRIRVQLNGGAACVGDITLTYDRL